jgi:hypothetical protein
MKLWLYAVNFYDNQDADWAKDLYMSGSEVTISADCPVGYEGKPKVEVALQVGEAGSTLNGLEKAYSKGTCNKCVEGKFLMNTGEEHGAKSKQISTATTMSTNATLPAARRLSRE